MTPSGGAASGNLTNSLTLGRAASAHIKMLRRAQGATRTAGGLPQLFACGSIKADAFVR
jgi:hypothetical protein